MIVDDVEIRFGFADVLDGKAEVDLMCLVNVGNITHFTL
jgi:hypothetical protein